MKYFVTAVTGDLWNAGTDASVFVTLYGERGDTGVRLLNRNKEKKFLKGEVCQQTVTYSYRIAIYNFSKLDTAAHGIPYGHAYTMQIYLPGLFYVRM